MVQGRNLMSHAEVSNEIPEPAWRYRERKSRALDGAGSESARKTRHSLQMIVEVEQVSGSMSNRKFFSGRVGGELRTRGDLDMQPGEA